MSVRNLAKASSESPGGNSDGPSETSAWWLLRAALKNVAFLALVAGIFAAHQTGYFSRDRIDRSNWMALYEWPKDRPGKIAYAATFPPDLLTRAGDKIGFWELYNGAGPETVKIEGGALTMRYALAWLGINFNHLAFQPRGLYRVRFEAKVDGEAAAILMRNRQLDYMRERLPTTGGEFKEFTADYAAPDGRLDQVRVVFMPDGRGAVAGSLTIRKFRIEQLEK